MLSLIKTVKSSALVTVACTCVPLRVSVLKHFAHYGYFYVRCTTGFNKHAKNENKKIYNMSFIFNVTALINILKQQVAKNIFMW